MSLQQQRFGTVVVPAPATATRAGGRGPPTLSILTTRGQSNSLRSCEQSSQLRLVHRAEAMRHPLLPRVIPRLPSKFLLGVRVVAGGDQHGGP
jgi:hypothetical protein